MLRSNFGLGSDFASSRVTRSCAEVLYLRLGVLLTRRTLLLHASRQYFRSFLIRLFKYLFTVIRAATVVSYKNADCTDPASSLEMEFEKISNSPLAFSKCFLLSWGSFGVSFVMSETLNRFFNWSLYWSKFWYCEEKFMMTSITIASKSSQRCRRSHLCRLA